MDPFNRIPGDLSIIQKTGWGKMKSIYDRLAEMSDELKKLGNVRMSNELNTICDEIDSIDTLLEKQEPPVVKKVRKQLYGEAG
jgi:septation ring formation regulator EzrA